jgi:ankyrin repeat protein
MKKTVLYLFISLFLLSSQVFAQETGIFHILKTGSYPQLERFLRHNPNAINDTGLNGITPLVFAVETENVKVVKLLLHYGADPLQPYRTSYDEKGRLTRLHNAFSEALGSPKKEEILKLFIRSGVDINQPVLYYDIVEKRQIKHYYLPMIVRGGSPNILSFLIKRGADPTVKFREKRSMLHMVTSPHTLENDDLTKLRILIKGGADPNELDEKGRTLLHRIIEVPANSLPSKYQINLKKCFELLIAEGADLNRPDDHGWTPLHSAVWFSNAEAIKLLINAGAKTDVKLRNGETPKDLAKKLKRDGLVELLDNLEAKNM